MPNGKVIGALGYSLGAKPGGIEIPAGLEPNIDVSPMAPLPASGAAAADLVGLRPIPNAFPDHPVLVRDNATFDMTTGPRRRSPETLRAYRRRAAEIHQMAADAEGVPPSDLDPIDIAFWLRDARTTLRTHSWLTYKTACRQTWLTYHPPGWEEGVAMLNEMTSRTTLSPRSDGRPRKSKSVSPFDLTLLTDWLAARRDKNAYGRAAANLLIATLHTGLRPSEWPRAWFEFNSDGADIDPGAIHLGAHVINDDHEPGRLILAVDTLKTTNGHGHPHVRRLDVSGFDKRTLVRIEAAIKSGRMLVATGRFKATMVGLAQILTRANETLWPRRTGHITLTSMRHQFLANAKSKLSRREVAALGGHSSTTTATQNYGRRNAGWSTGGHIFVIVLPIPDEASLMAVREPDLKIEMMGQPELAAPVDKVVPDIAASIATRVLTPGSKIGS